LRSVPVWVTVAVLALILFGLFAWYKYQLVHASRALEQRIAAIGAMRPPPAPAIKPLRLKELLSAEIARGTVSVEEDDRHSAVTFRGDDMFVPGQARLSAAILPVLAKVAEEINQVSGAVQVTGHSDNQPIRTREYPNNLVLSEKRAAAAAQVLQDKGIVASRLKIEGRGDTVPLADNAIAAGRARNRRVDIVVTQGNTPLDVAPTRSASAAVAPAVAPSPAPAAFNAQPARNTGR